LANPRATSEHLGELLSDSGATALVASADNRAAIPHVAAGSSLTGIKTFITCDWPGAPSSRPRKHHISSDLAALVYTSGSSGTSKGVMLTHWNLMSAAVAIGEYLEINADDVILNVLPLAFTYGFGQITTAFLAGA